MREIFIYPSRDFMFKGLEHMFQALKLLYTAFGQVFQALEHKISLGEKYFSPR
jgi:hypothetical protein